VIEEDSVEEEEEVPSEMEEGDRIFTMVVHVEPRQIRAMENISQRLAAAYHRNTIVKSFKEMVPKYLQDFEDVFTEESYDVLLEWKQWDHVVELVLGAPMKNCKVYPLSPSEQMALDEFITENLATGQIRPSKSPMASPCFFIKKKDGSL